LLNFLVHEYTFYSIYPPKKLPEETWSKIYLGQDLDPDPELELDPDVFKRRIRIRSKLVLMRNNANGLFCSIMINTRPINAIGNQLTGTCQLQYTVVLSDDVFFKLILEYIH
jgi:hypothetical protein